MAKSNATPFVMPFNQADPMSLISTSDYIAISGGAMLADSSFRRPQTSGLANVGGKRSNKRGSPLKMS